MSAPARARLQIREVDTRRHRTLSTHSADLTMGEPLLIGREGLIGIGVDPDDPGVSRRALEVTATADGWELSIVNRHGAWVQLWGHAALRMEHDSSLRRAWPRVGVRIVGGDRELDHWVLLECDDYPLPKPTDLPEPAGPPGTDLARIPKALTDTQLQAVITVFAQYLAWPPISGPAPMALASVANRLHVTDGAIAERLKKVQERAYAFGLHHQVGVSDPDYVYLLARHGYLPLPASFSALVP